MDRAFEINSPSTVVAQARLTPLREFLRSAEIEHITRALERTGGNQSEAARQLGVPRRTLVRKIGDLGIDRSIGRRQSVTARTG
ncbi:MAG TPA: helix-turn-helix domain-containing protein [Kofleriaceae bacterium]|nr:helix-turn-helix domain-containing protein [Kofleriaceae bacterium]